jgi:thiamine-phosphate pyrophosphorylase
MKALYVTDRGGIGDSAFRRTLEELAGAPGLTVQLREPRGSDAERLRWALLAREVLGPGNALYVNRRLDVALAAGADGVHLPADGLPLPRVRAHAPRGLRIGASTHSPAEALQAIAEGADLVVIGPIFDTPSKRQFGAPLGVEALDRLPPLSSHGREVFAIGGIDESRLPAVAARHDRISGVAAIRLFQESEDPRRAAERIAAA